MLTVPAADEQNRDAHCWGIPVLPVLFVRMKYTLACQAVV